MTQLPEVQPRFDFFVYIVESPSAPDLYHGRSEGVLLANALRLDNIPCVTRTAISGEAFWAALRVGLPEAMKYYPGRYPVVHLSAHGDSSGIALSNGESLAWGVLRELVTPINESLNGSLLLCMSACQGYSAVQMAMRPTEPPYPYFAMVGHLGKPTWSDTAVAYLTFYHLVAKGQSIRGAVEAMNYASGGGGWAVETAEESRKAFLDHMRTHVKPIEAQRELEGIAESDQTHAEAKALEGAASDGAERRIGGQQDARGAS